MYLGKTYLRGTNDKASSKNNVNPLPCGYYGDPKRSCKCLPGLIARYQQRISGPILDRIDIHVSVPTVDTQKLISERNENKSKTSKEIQLDVQAARELQTLRFRKTSSRRRIWSNSEMSTKDVKEYCEISDDVKTILRSAISTMNLSARSYFKVIKVARTIADLANSKQILINHVAEALQYRPKDTNL